MSVTNDQCTFRNIREEQRLHLYRSGSLKLRKDMFTFSINSGALEAVHCFIANTGNFNRHLNITYQRSMSFLVILLFNHVSTIFMLEIQAYHPFHFNLRFTYIVLLL